MITNHQVKQLAREFCKQLAEYLTPEQINEINNRNASYDQGICASHEFCDPNYFMDEAFKVVMRRAAQLDQSATTYNEDMDAVNGAWRFAKLNGFVFTSPSAEELLKLCERAFNEIPNRKLSRGVNTYALAAQIGAHLRPLASV